MTTPRAVESTPVTRNGHDDDEPSGRTTLERDLAKAALARSHEDAARYESMTTVLVRVDGQVDALIEDTRKTRVALSTLTDAVSRLTEVVNALKRDRNADDERHGQIVAALARIESRESVHRTKLDSITEEVTEVKAAHGGWLAVGSFMDRHRKLASTIAFLVLLGFQIFHLLKK